VRLLFSHYYISSLGSFYFFLYAYRSGLIKRGVGQADNKLKRACRGRFILAQREAV